MPFHTEVFPTTKNANARKKHNLFEILQKTTTMAIVVTWMLRSPCSAYMANRQQMAWALVAHYYDVPSERTMYVSVNLAGTLFGMNHTTFDLYLFRVNIDRIIRQKPLKHWT